MYYFFSPYSNRKNFQKSTIRLNRKCSKVVGISSDIFGNVRKSSKNHRKSSEVAQTFSEITVMNETKISRVCLRHTHFCLLCKVFNTIRQCQNPSASFRKHFSIVKCVCGKLFVFGRRTRVKTTKKIMFIIVLRHG